MSEGYLVQPIGNHKGYQHADRNAEKSVFDGVPKYQPEILIREDLDVVFEPDSLLGPKEVPFQS